MNTLDTFLNPGVGDLATVAGEFDRRANEITRLKAALAEAEAERIALADQFRKVLEGQGTHKTTAAIYVQTLIDNARTNVQEARNG